MASPSSPFGQDLRPDPPEAVLYLAAATLAPVVPLALTMMSLEELLKTLLGTLF